ncbi:MAG: hypothetical protein HPY58_14245 [Firmicutes bacterium]|nr:hypothetical protein [Bacillota bacterium]
MTYAAPGEDVAVARSSGWDYRFRNNRERPVEVVMNWTEGELKVEIWELKKTEGGDCD